MNTNIGSKINSILWGFFGSILALYLNTVYQDKIAYSKLLSEIQSNKAESGRFQLVQLGTMRRDQFLIDSKSGHVWVHVCAGKTQRDGVSCDPEYWQREDVIGIPTGGL